MGVPLSVLDCLVGSNPDDDRISSSSDQQRASEILTIILSSDATEEIRKSVNETIDTAGWTENIAEALLHGLEHAISTGAQMARASAHALKKATEAAVGFAKDHPVYTTILALGILVVVAPWVIEVLGFGELGPIEGTFAALWQSRYAGYVPKGSLFSFPQKLGMTWG